MDPIGHLRRQAAEKRLALDCVRRGGWQYRLTDVRYGVLAFKSNRRGEAERFIEGRSV